MIKNNNNMALEVENVKILTGNFRNFAGEPDRFNPQGGKRYFNFEIDDAEIANQLLNDGWRVKTWAPHDENADPRYYLKVTIGRYVQFARMVQSNGDWVDLIDERAPQGVDPQEALGCLDRADIRFADLVITPRRHDDGMFTAYLKSGWFIIEEDPFAHKYASAAKSVDTEAVPF
jgi:hypothetical protein